MFYGCSEINCKKKMKYLIIGWMNKIYRLVET